MSEDQSVYICNCNNWKNNMRLIDNAISVAIIHHWKYTGKPFVYCPWCGNPLVEEGKINDEKNPI